MNPRRILQNGCETARGHRGDFETCPHCDHKMEFDHWIRIAHTLCLQPVFIRYGSAVVLSECPNCFKTSWIHIELNDIRAPQSWKIAAQKEAAALRLVALRRWGASLCWRCAKLESGTVEYTTQRVCEAGLGQAAMSCPMFHEIDD